MAKILVLGASGTVGRPLVKALSAKGEAVKAASRGGHSVEGAEGVVFEYGSPETFDAAFEGVDRAFVLLPSGYVNATELLLPVIEAAVARKVKIVFQSAFGVDADDSIPYRQVEIALEKSGARYVILRPNWFADNFHTFWKAGIDQGQIALPAGDGKSSFIDARDIAACAAAALTSGDFDGKAFNLTGPEALSYAQAAEILSQVVGKPIAYRPVDDEAFVGMLTGAGAPPDYAAFLASIFYPVREGWTAVVTADVETLTGAPPRSLRTYAQDHARELSA
ncbi:SDR family oxidoreductase [Methylocystis iwaonis]|uniref:SDR family oxidoreductase n=1 Tax=Methylocystis iwaonis TaxID=2885079 RepID=UPI002E7BE7CF|nr:SDR family oxidoreductase [Methylocystis iwaonis]